MATRKRARTDTLPLTVDALAAFIGDDQPDSEQLEQAMALASEAAAAFTGRPIGDTAPHAIRHGIHLLASRLLITTQLEGPIRQADIPLVVRAFWRAADAGHQQV